MNQDKQIVNVVVVDDDFGPENSVGTTLQVMLLAQSKLKIHELMVVLVEGINQSRDNPGSCHPHALLMSSLGQLFANCLHLLATADHRLSFNEEVAELFGRLLIEVEKVETGNEGGGRA